MAVWKHVVFHIGARSHSPADQVPGHVALVNHHIFPHHYVYNTQKPMKVYHKTSKNTNENRKYNSLK